VREKQMRTALADIRNLREVSAISSLIRLETGASG